MKSVRFLTPPAAALLLFVAPGIAAEKAPRYQTHSDNRVTLQGTTSIHDWVAETRTIEGFLEPGSGFPTEPGQTVPPGKIAAAAEVSIPVTTLHSGSKAMDRIMHERLKEATHRHILYQLQELQLKQAPASKVGPYAFEARGSFVVAGVTNQNTMPVEVLPLGGGRIKIQGKTSVSMTDFGIEAPVPQIPDAPAIRVGDEVSLTFEWLLER